MMPRMAGLLICSLPYLMPWLAASLRMRCLWAISIFSSVRYPDKSITSMRSSRGAEMVCRLLAVAMKSAFERSKSTSIKLSWKALFCSGSSTSSKAEEGSPLKSLPSLSTSSKIKTGLEVPALIKFWMIRPGMAPMYVRRCPRISASSCKPPNDMRMYLRPSDSATDLPNEVLPTPGGPTKQMMGDFMSPFSFSTAMCSSMRSLIDSRP